MPKLTILALTLASSLVTALGACAQPEAAAEPRQSTQSKIIGGTEDDGDSAVVAVLSIQSGDAMEGLCTGEIISPHLVLTASHCVEPTLLGFTPDQISVVTDPDADDPAPENVLTVVSYLQHPQYDPVSGVHDVALLELADGTDIPPLAVNSVPLTPDVEGMTALVIGYGRTVDDDANSGGTKNQVGLQISDIQPTTFLAKALSATQCHGDSGGPVLLNVGGVPSIVGLGWETVNLDGTCGSGVRNTRVDPEAAFIQHFLTADSLGDGT